MQDSQDVVPHKARPASTQGHAAQCFPVMPLDVVHKPEFEPTCRRSHILTLLFQYFDMPKGWRFHSFHKTYSWGFTIFCNAV